MILFIFITGLAFVLRVKCGVFTEIRAVVPWCQLVIIRLPAHSREQMSVLLRMCLSQAKKRWSIKLQLEDVSFYPHCNTEDANVLKALWITVIGLGN